eukprot:UN2964
MVMFYDPSSPDSKALKPKFEKAAQKLEELGQDGVALAEVDATSQEAVATKYVIQRCPTVVVFKGGEVYEAVTRTTSLATWGPHRCRSPSAAS